MNRLLPLVFVFFSTTVSAADSSYESGMRATIRITTTQESGTAFFVKKSDTVFLVTAAHVFKKMEGETCTAIYRKLVEGESKRHEEKIKIRDGKRELWTAHKTIDLAFLKIELPDNVNITPLPFDQICEKNDFSEKKIHVGLDVFVPCFPTRTESNPAGWPILRRGSIASHPLENKNQFFIDTPSFGGESGAPCFAVIDEKIHLVGVVFGMQRQNDKIKSPFLESTIFTPLSLGIVSSSSVLKNLLDDKS